MDGRYQGGGTAGGRWGCGCATFLGLPLLSFLALLSSLGDCAPGVRCHRGSDADVVGPVLVLILATGLGVRWLVNRLGRGRRDGDEDER